MRAPAPSFGDAIEVPSPPPPPALPDEDPFFDRMRRCTSVPPARTANDYLN